MSFELYRLIQSFSGKEQSAFKQFAQSLGGKGTNHVRLFTEYHGLPRFTPQEDEKIRQNIKFNSKNAYSQCKAYLQEWLFRFLRYDYSNKNEKEIRLEVTMTNLYLDILILVELNNKKELSEPLQEKIESAKQFAYRYYFFLDLIKILHIQKFLLRAKGDTTSNTHKIILGLDEEIAAVYRDLQIEHDMVGRYDQVYQLEKRQDIPLLEVELKRHFEYLSNLNIPRMTLRVKMAIYYIKDKYYAYIKDDLSARTKNLEDARAFIASDKKLLNDQQERYLNLEKNYVNSLVISNAFSEDKIKETINLINSITPSNNRIKLKIEQVKCYAELQFFLRNLRFNQIINMKAQIEKITYPSNNYELSDDERFIFQYVLAFSIFIQHKSNPSARSEARNMALTLKNDHKMTTRQELRNEFLLIAIALEEYNQNSFDSFFYRIKYLIRNSNTDTYYAENELIRRLRQVFHTIIQQTTETEKTKVKQAKLAHIHEQLKDTLFNDYGEFLYWMSPIDYETIQN